MQLGSSVSHKSVITDLFKMNQDTYSHVSIHKFLVAPDLKKKKNQKNQ